MNKSSPSFVILNGEVISTKEASIHVDDRGFLYGESIFTTIRCYGGVPFRVIRHCDRLNNSLSSPVVDIDYHVDFAKLETDIQQLLKLNKCPDAAVRFTITRGCATGPLPPQRLTPTTLLSLHPFAPDTSLLSRGASLCISNIRRDPAGDIGKHKLGSYFPSLLARRQAFNKGHDESVICDTDGNFLECACSNLFAVLDGTLVTPDTTENILPGIAREGVLECAAAIGLKTSLETLTSDIQKNAKEWLITNSLMEIVPVASLGENRFFVPGPVTSRLLGEFKDLVASEIRSEKHE
ncbi:MAG: hypothetical protein HOC91_08360 [Nitrospinaceae bacterium]|jgi:branched-subunit amino acid aminotransferase/4-amino-4-deoxychorismate lyase|nr:hypothetical protein [Nitrospinaceae bacterium]MBT3434258.1 hypothetical protein [Nitrospinaceae bacterium]MBT3819947.1 hypothetical protein [Nitrospinaceae bacterium]MBT4093718.1 hypothetical protein [Nitrospinaceae bacterium]MBT4430511.1 hypothetical protein [Nitrospinaceae bacterium]